MELRHIRCFQAVAEELRFSRAAARLRVAQPAVSRTIKELEAVLGAQVLERSRHHVKLTPAGEVLVAEAARLLEAWDEAVRRVRRTAEGSEGELRLGYLGPPTRTFLGRLLAAYRGRYPQVAIHLEERTPERVWEMVARGRLRVGITRLVVAQEALGLRTMLLREERLGAVVPAGHAVADRAWLPWTALAAEPLIVLARREGIGLHDAVLAGCRQAGFAPRLAHTPSLIGTVLRYVEAGVGWGVVTESVVGPGSGLRFVPLRPAQHVPLVLVWREDEDPPAVRRFRELVAEWKQADRLWGPGAAVGADAVGRTAGGAGKSK